MNYFTLRIKISSGYKWNSRVDCSAICSNCRFFFLRTSRTWNRSLVRPMKIGLSSVNILGKVKSLKACINTWTRMQTTDYKSIKPFSFRNLFLFQDRTPGTATPAPSKWRLHLVLRAVLVSSFQWTSSCRNWQSPQSQWHWENILMSHVSIWRETR